MRRHQFLILAVALAALFAFAACSEGNSTSTTGGTETTGAGGETSEVTIENFAFNPGVLTVPVGTTVTWTNNDGIDHTATADDGTFDSGVIGDGESFQFTFDEAGEFAYSCSLHTNMTGAIVVEG